MLKTLRFTCCSAILVGLASCTGTQSPPVPRGSLHVEDSVAIPSEVYYYSGSDSAAGYFGGRMGSLIAALANTPNADRIAETLRWQNFHIGREVRSAMIEALPRKSRWTPTPQRQGQPRLELRVDRYGLSIGRELTIGVRPILTVHATLRSASGSTLWQQTETFSPSDTAIRGQYYDEYMSRPSMLARDLQKAARLVAERLAGQMPPPATSTIGAGQ